MTEDFKAGLRRAMEIAQMASMPGPGGVNICGGIPSEIAIGIGRGHYNDDYELAADVANSIRAEVVVLIQMELDGKLRPHTAVSCSP